MADELNNKQNIDDSKRSLNDFNDALRESIDYAKQLSKAITSLPSSLGLSESKNKELVKGLQSYNSALSDTLKLSNKVAQGKAKEKEVQDQLNNLQKKYTEFVDQNAASFGKRGRFIEKQKEIQKEIAKLEEQDIKRLAKINTAEQQIEQTLANIAAEEERRLINSTVRRQADKNLKNLKEQLREHQNTIKALESQSNLSDRLIAKKKEEKDKLDQAVKAYKEIEKSYQEQIESNETLLKQQRESTTLGKLRSKDINTFGEGLKEAASFLSGISAAFKPIVDFAFKISDQTAQLQKNLVLSQDDARNLRQDFNAIAVSSGDIAVNTERLVEANAALGKQLGFSSKFTADLNVQFVKLTKQIGLSEEAAGGLAKLSIATGSTLEESKNIALGTSQALSSQYGIQLNQREVLEEIGKVSGQTLAMLKASPQAIAAAVAQAKLLGTNLDTVRKQAASLLDFETSIENELQAELLTGQQLNLERARTAALTGDLTTAMQELNNQNIDFNKFSNMNVIAQDKVAAALGLSSDELSDQLLKQQYMNKSREEVAALAGEEVAERIEALKAQDKFNLAVEKMQDLIGNVVGGPLGKLVDMMASLAENSTLLFTAMGGLAALSFTKLVVGLAASAVQAGLLAAGTAATASAITLGVGAIAIAAGIATMMAAYNQAKEDATQPVGDMFSSSGKTIVSPKEGGLFELSDNDEFAAAPGLGDMISNTNRQTIIAQDNSALIEELRAIKAEMAGTKEGINKLNTKTGTVNIDGQRAGTAQLMGNYNLA